MILLDVHTVRVIAVTNAGYDAPTGEATVLYIGMASDFVKLSVWYIVLKRY